MGTIRRRCRQSSQSRGHLALGLLLGGVLGATAGLLVGERQYIAGDVGITEPADQHAADQPQLSPAGEPDSPDDDCARDPLVAWPMLGLVAGAILGVSAAEGYAQMLRLLRESESKRMRRPPSEVTGR